MLGTDRILYNVSQKHLSGDTMKNLSITSYSTLIKGGSSCINFATHPVCMRSREMQFSPVLYPIVPGQDIRSIKHWTEELYLYKAIQSLHVATWHNSGWRKR